jgi:hypothetical protein
VSKSSRTHAHWPAQRHVLGRPTCFQGHPLCMALVCVRSRASRSARGNGQKRPTTFQPTEALSVGREDGHLFAPCVGAKHAEGCDVERCPHRGGQVLGCAGFDPADPRPSEMGQTLARDSGSSSTATGCCPISTAYFAECVWNAERQRWEPDLRSTGWRRAAHRSGDFG